MGTMKRILMTGMSGTGKSALVVALAEPGFRAIDLGEPEWSESAEDGDWIWREERVHRADPAAARHPHR